MTRGLVAFLFAAALILAQLRSATNRSYTRMIRLVPPATQHEDAAASEVRSLATLRRFLNVIDPTFGNIEPMLRSLGVTSSQWLMTIQGGRIAGALFAAFLSVQLASVLVRYPFVRYVLPALVFVSFMVGVNKLIRSASLNRHRLIRRELTLGIEIFCIFLEGGQSLDQTFRSFCEICGQALPYLASIQRTLIADIDNGVAYEKAIERWADHLGIEEAKQLSVLFIDSLVHGTELVPHMRQFSADLVEQRILGARASIGVKSSQLTVVMVLFFLPAILAFLTAPAFTAVATALDIHR
jgi:tight adherence protein C